MAQQVFSIGQGDTGPPIQWVCQDGNGNVVVVTGATVTFHMTDMAGNVVVNHAGDVANGPGGVVEYQWQAADTANTGTFNAEFKVVFLSGVIETFPVSPKILVRIFSKLA